MIRWSLDPIGPGPLRRVRILADGKPVGGVAFLTQDQTDDLAAHLTPDSAGQSALLREAIETLERIGCQFFACKGPTLDPIPMATCYVCEFLGRLLAAVDASDQPSRALPCARCGRPVDAGQATHPDCQPLVCRFCTQCGRQLGAEEQAAGCRMCLVGCAPLADAADGDVVADIRQARGAQIASVCQVVDTFVNPVCTHRESGGYLCERIDRHDDDGHAFGRHTIEHARMGNGWACSAIGTAEPKPFGRLGKVELINVGSAAYWPEAGVTEAPDIAAAPIQQPDTDPLGPPSFVPEQRQGGESL